MRPLETSERDDKNNRGGRGGRRVKSHHLGETARLKERRPHLETRKMDWARSEGGVLWRFENWGGGGGSSLIGQ